jgi:glycosyltransferase involved in cell wall biosynthesis
MREALTGARPRATGIPGQFDFATHCQSEPNRMKPPLRLVYVVGTYPTLTITFIDREIKILRQLGADIQVLAVRSPGADTLLSAGQIELGQGVIYLLPLRDVGAILCHVYFAFARPATYFATLIYLLTRPHPSSKAVSKTLLHFAEGVYAAYLLRHRDLHGLHAHFIDRAATIALVVGRLLGKPYTLSIHAGPDVFVERVLLREKISEARLAATCTAYNKSFLESILGLELGQKIVCIHHGLELKIYQPGPLNSGSRPQILSIGQLVDRKGFDHLIRACRHLKDRGYEFMCHIVGEGPRRRDLTSLINELQLGSTVFLRGALPHEQVIEIYRQATVFVLPCVRSSTGSVDGIPNVVAEAMAMRVPVIASDISGIPELVQDGVNGILTPPEDDAALVAAISRVLDDDTLRNRLAQNGRQSVEENFDAERNVWQLAATLWPEWFAQTSALADKSTPRQDTHE